MSELKTVGALNRLQPRIPKSVAVATIENPDKGRVTDYGVGAVVLDRNGVAWQRDIDNLTTEALELPGGQTFWWKVGSSADHYTAKDIPLPAKLMAVSDE